MSPSRTRNRRPAWPAAGGFDEFSDLLGETDLFPAAAPERDVSREYRRWAFESAALDLALRQAGVNLAAALGREPRPVNFVSSMRLAGFGSDEPSSIDPLLARLDVYPTLRFKLDPVNDWDDELIAALARTGAVDSLDLKGFYKDTPVDVETDPELYAKLIEAFPGAWLEDPDVNEETRPLLDAVARAGHLGRADPLDRRHRGDALGAEDGQRQALALRPDLQPVRRLRLLRGARHRRLRRRPDGARPGPRPDPVPGLDLPSRHAQRRRPLRLQRPRAGDPAGPADAARWSRASRPPGSAGRDRVGPRMSFADTLNEQIANEFRRRSSTSRSPSTTTPRRCPGSPRSSTARRSRSATTR